MTIVYTVELLGRLMALESALKNVLSTIQPAAATELKDEFRKRANEWRQAHSEDDDEVAVWLAAADAFERLAGPTPVKTPEFPKFTVVQGDNES